MIKLTLHQLNKAYPSLKKAAESLTAGKMKYRFARVVSSADTEIEILGKHLAELAQKHGAEMLGGNRFNFSEKQNTEAIAFNKEADEWLRTQTTELWGDLEFFYFDDVDKAADPKTPLSAATLSDLLWLITDNEKAEEPPKTAAAAS